MSHSWHGCECPWSRFAPGGGRQLTARRLPDASFVPVAHPSATLATAADCRMPYRQ